MVKSFKQNIIQRFLNPHEVFLRSGKETRKLRLPLSKILKVQLPCKKKCQDTYKWLPSEESLKNFSQVDLMKKKDKHSILKFKPKRIGKGVIEIFYININEPEEILDRFKLYYSITGNQAIKQTPPMQEYRQ